MGVLWPPAVPSFVWLLSGLRQMPGWGGREANCSSRLHGPPVPLAVPGTPAKVHSAELALPPLSLRGGVPPDVRGGVTETFLVLVVLFAVPAKLSPHPKRPVTDVTPERCVVEGQVGDGMPFKHFGVSQETAPSTLVHHTPAITACSKPRERHAGIGEKKEG